MLDPYLITQRQAFSAVRRQLARHTELQAPFAELWLQVSEEMYSEVVGPIFRVWQSVLQLGWTWENPFELVSDVGDRLHLPSSPWGWFPHVLGTSQRRSIVRRVPATHNDLRNLGSGEYPYGLDDVANRDVLKAKSGKMALLDRWRRTLLITFMVGGVQSHQRMSRAGHASDPSPV